MGLALAAGALAAPRPLELAAAGQVARGAATAALVGAAMNVAGAARPAGVVPPAASNPVAAATAATTLAGWLSSAAVSDPATAALTAADAVTPRRPDVGVSPAEAAARPPSPSLAHAIDAAADAAVAAGGIAVDARRAVDDRATEAAYAAAAAPLARLSGARTATAPAREALQDEAVAAGEALVRAANRVGGVAAAAAEDDPALKRVAARATREAVATAAASPTAAALVNATANSPIVRLAASTTDAAAGAAAGAAARAVAGAAAAVAAPLAPLAPLNATGTPSGPPCGTPAVHITVSLGANASCRVDATANGAPLPGSGAPCDALLFGRACPSLVGGLTVSVSEAGDVAAAPAALSSLGLDAVSTAGSLEVALPGGAAPSSWDAMPRLTHITGGPSIAPGALFDDAGLFFVAAPPPGAATAAAPGLARVTAVGGPVRVQGSGWTDLSSLASLNETTGGLAIVDNPRLAAAAGAPRLAAVGAGSGPDANAGHALVVERNPKLVALALPALSSVGGQVVVRGNPALAALALPALASVNAVNSTRYGPASVVIADNPLLADVAGLLPLARCAAPRADPVLIQLHPAPPPGVPRSSPWYVCTFTRQGHVGAGRRGRRRADAADAPPPPPPPPRSWAQICRYHLVEGGRMLDHDSHWVLDGVCAREGREGGGGGGRAPPGGARRA